jgi:hypothetical protein
MTKILDLQYRTLGDLIQNVDISPALEGPLKVRLKDMKELLDEIGKDSAADQKIYDDYKQDKCDAGKFFENDPYATLLIEAIKGKPAKEGAELHPFLPKIKHTMLYNRLQELKGYSSKLTLSDDAVTHNELVKRIIDLLEIKGI